MKKEREMRLEWSTVTTKSKSYWTAFSPDHAAWLQTWPENPCKDLHHNGLMVPPKFAKWLGDQLPKGTFIDLFCGHGGFSKGFLQAGHKHVLGVDVNHKILKCYKREIGECVCFDLTKTKGIDFPQVDYVLSSPPCNEFSVANNEANAMAGLKLVKAGFWWISYIQPKIWIMENVPGMKRHYKNSKIYDMHDYGVPQHRRRAITSNFDFKSHKFQTTMEGFI